MGWEHAGSCGWTLRGGGEGAPAGVGRVGGDDGDGGGGGGGEHGWEHAWSFGWTLRGGGEGASRRFEFQKNMLELKCLNACN